MAHRSPRFAPAALTLGALASILTAAPALAVPSPADPAPAPTSPDLDRVAWLEALAGTTGRVATPEVALPTLEELAWLAPTPLGMRVAGREALRVDGAPWIRLALTGDALPEATGLDLGAAIRITSPADGGSQTLDRARLAQWSGTSAYFTGDTVIVEILVDADAPAAPAVFADAVIVPEPVDFNTFDRSLCGGDDRVVSSDPRDARFMPEGCTAFLFNRRTNDLLTAGHCDFLPGSLVQFNTPLSTSGGTPMPPAPEDQYPVDFDSIQSARNVGGVFLGNDWAVFGVFDNADTGLSPLAAQGASRMLAETVPSPDGRSIRITGYGTTSFPISATLNQAQKTHTGSYLSRDGTVLRYNPDTTGGNSGSAVIDDTTGLILGIHTNAGCVTVGNQGMTIVNANLQNALRNPAGISRGETLSFTYPEGLPASVPASGATLPLDIRGSGGGIVLGGSPMVHIDAGQGFTAAIPLNNRAGEFSADLPPADCGNVLRLYFSAQTVDGRTITDPPAGASDPYTIAVANADAETSLLDQPFESLAGWNVSGAPPASGGWGVGSPAGDAGQAPEADFDATGAALLTGPAGEQLGGAAALLASPSVDLSGADQPVLRFATWWATTQLDDGFAAQYSINDGASWTTFTSAQDTAAWRFRQWNVRELLGDPADLPESFRVRFVARDVNANSVAEAAVDAFDIVEASCSGCPADID
ncbi:MAG: hypothetical protein AAFP26_10175, partial [Planctomycetota bacterium]